VNFDQSIVCFRGFIDLLALALSPRLPGETGLQMFYISTVGSTASLWLARVLSLHPDLACFHGARSISAAHHEPPRHEPHRFAQELSRLYLLADGSKYFGAVHGFVSSSIKPEIDAVHGGFAAMCRHPITRVNSLLHREAQHVQSSEPLTVAEVFRIFRFYSIDKTDAAEADRLRDCDFYVATFFSLCHATISEDMWNFNNLHERQLFRYEKLTSDPRYFRLCFEHLVAGCRAYRTHVAWRPAGSRLKQSAEDADIQRNSDWQPAVPPAECSDEYLAVVFNQGVINEKASDPRSAAEIFANWPDQFKLIFAMALQSCGGSQALRRYADFGYQLPEYCKTILHGDSAENLFQRLLAGFPMLQRAVAQTEQRSLESRLPHLGLGLWTRARKWLRR
jgi:hypothetical protein